MADPTVSAEQFELHRARLRAVAYRMLGSLSDAEDAVQEAWVRLSRADDAAIVNLGGWLTTVVGRVCIDMLRARRARPEHPVGAWLPEPLISTDDRMSPEQESLLADSVGMALLVVLDTLAPSERLAFVLHDMFAVSFDEIAPILDKTPAATRQLASRARRRIRGADTTPNPDLGTQRKVVAAFLAAARASDFAALIEVLHPAVVFRVDAGGRRVQTPALLTGARDVATQSASAAPGFARLCDPALVNGAAGLVVHDPTGRIVAAAGMTVIGGLIREIDLVLDPDKLTALNLA